VYRVDGKSGQVSVVSGDIARPNGLAFSPDESKLYVVEGGTSPRSILAYDVADGGTRITSKRKLIGRINLPGRCANICFGGTYRNRLFMTASSSLYHLYVNTHGALGD